MSTTSRAIAYRSCPRCMGVGSVRTHDAIANQDIEIKCSTCSGKGVVGRLG